MMSQTKRRFFSGACEGFAGSSAVRKRSLPMLQSDAEALADTLSFSRHYPDFQPSLSSRHRHDAHIDIATRD